MTVIDVFDPGRAADPPRVKQDDDHRWWFVVDPVLIAVAAGITVLGILLVYSATRGPATGAEPADTSFLERQTLFAVVGFGLAFVAALVDVRRIRQLTPAAFLGLLGLLAGVLVLGVEVNGARAWFSAGGIRFQPSEPGKIVLVVALAAVLSAAAVTVVRLGVALLVAALPIGLILLQPDMGTVLVYIAVVAAMVMMSNVPGRVIALLAILSVTAVVGVFQSDLLADYQRDRLTVFVLDEGAREELSADLAKVAYNAEQSQIAIGNGGLTGQGLFQGTQTASDLVPFQETDWIFSVAGEELGFRGAGLLLGLYALLLFRMWRIAVQASDRFDRLLTVGVMAMFLFQVFQSAGMAMGMMPVTGIPLPMVSYGGSSMVTSMVALGLVLGVHRRRYDFTDRHGS